MIEEASADFVYRAEIATNVEGATFAESFTDLRAGHPDIDLLPPSREEDVAHALLDDRTLEAVVRAGYTVTVTGIEEGPPDPEMIMTDAQAEERMARMLGEPRITRGRAD